MVHTDYYILEVLSSGGWFELLRDPRAKDIKARALENLAEYPQVQIYRVEDGIRAKKPVFSL